MSWANRLIDEIANPSNHIISSHQAVVVKDKFPKATHHFLVLPKADISSIFDLNRSHLPLLKELHQLAQTALLGQGLRWEHFQVGFHAHPSMHRLHMHVISKDFSSPTLRTKAHWNSFNTELFVPYEQLCAHLEKDNSFKRLSEDLVGQLLNAPLVCNQCRFVPRSMPSLKEHLAKHVKKAKTNQ